MVWQAVCQTCWEQESAREMRALIAVVGAEAPEVEDLRKRQFRAGVSLQREAHDRAAAERLREEG